MLVLRVISLRLCRDFGSHRAIREKENSIVYNTYNKPAHLAGALRLLAAVFEYGQFIITNNGTLQ